MTSRTFGLSVPFVFLLAGALLTQGNDFLHAVHLTVHGASIVRAEDNGDSRAELAGNVPPDAYFEVFVDGAQVCSSEVAVNTWEPRWNESCAFSARQDSAISLAVSEADPDGEVRLLGRWDGPLSALRKAAGELRFGPIRKLSYRLG
jgi:C2 domain-containing protein